MSVKCPESVAQLDEVVTRPNERVIDTLRNHEGDIAVLGAGGKMGFHLCRMLQRALEELGRSSRVLGVSRFGSAASREPFQAAGIETIAADLSTVTGANRVPPVPNVFFLAGVKFGTAHDEQLLNRMNVEMPARVAERFCKSRIVALSTGCVYAFTSPDSGGSTEQSETDPPGQYAQSCLGREQAFVDAAEQFGTQSTLVRLNYSVDLRYGVLVDIARSVLAGRPVDVTTGYVNVIWQGDALSHIIQCLGLASAPPAVVNVTGMPILSVRELAAEFGRRFRCQVQFTGREQSTAWLSNPARAHALFGPPEMPLERMLDWIAQWLQGGGATLDKPTHFENRDGQY